MNDCSWERGMHFIGRTHLKKSLDYGDVYVYFVLYLFDREVEMRKTTAVTFHCVTWKSLSDRLVQITTMVIVADVPLKFHSHRPIQMTKTTVISFVVFPLKPLSDRLILARVVVMVAFVLAFLLKYLLEFLSVYYC